MHGGPLCFPGGSAALHGGGSRLRPTRLGGRLSVVSGGRRGVRVPPPGCAPRFFHPGAVTGERGSGEAAWGWGGRGPAGAPSLAGLHGGGTSPVGSSDAAARCSPLRLAHTQVSPSLFPQYGFVNHALELLVIRNYGPEVWEDVK